MLRFQGRDFYEMSDAFGMSHGFLVLIDALYKVADDLNTETEERVKAGYNFVGWEQPILAFRKILSELDMELAIDSLDRFVAAGRSNDRNFLSLRDAMMELQGRIRDELSHMELWL